MVKPMPLRIQVEEIAFGKIFRLLSSMPGVVSIDIDADKIVKHSKQSNGALERAPRGIGSNSSICLMLTAARNGPVERKVLQDAIVKGGKAATTLNGQLHNAKTKKFLVKKGDKYELTAKGKSYLNEVSSNG